jgi:hypothetical protein
VEKKYRLKKKFMQFRVSRFNICLKIIALFIFFHFFTFNTLREITHEKTNSVRIKNSCKFFLDTTNSNSGNYFIASTVLYLNDQVHVYCSISSTFDFRLEDRFDCLPDEV